MFKKLIIVVFVAIFLASCGGGKYAEVKSVTKEMIAAYKAFNASVEEAEDEQAIIAAMNGLAESISVLKPKMKALQEKFPEIKSRKTMPDNIKEDYEQMREVQRVFMGLYDKKINEYLKDPAVKEANDNMTDIMFSQ